MNKSIKDIPNPTINQNLDTLKSKSIKESSHDKIDEILSKKFLDKLFIENPKNKISCKK
jgi:hypothetical protein